jgi:hypothetical protein
MFLPLLGVAGWLCNKLQTEPKKPLDPVENANTSSLTLDVNLFNASYGFHKKQKTTMNSVAEAYKRFCQ